MSDNVYVIVIEPYKKKMKTTYMSIEDIFIMSFIYFLDMCLEDVFMMFLRHFLNMHIGHYIYYRIITWYLKVIINRL